MKKYILILPIVSILLLGAHFYRQGETGIVVALALIIGFGLTRGAWVRLLWLLLLVISGLIWVHTFVNIVEMRLALGEPWIRLGLIMAGLSFMSVMSFLVLNRAVAQEFFHESSDQTKVRISIFLITTLGLSLAKLKAPFSIVLIDRFLPGWGWAEIVLLGYYAQWLGGKMVSPREHRLIRPRLWGFFSAVFFGQLFLGMLGVNELLMTGKLHLPVPALIVAGPVFRGEGLFMVILFSVTMILVGPAWCSHLCYIGVWDDTMSRLRKRSFPNPLARKMSLWGRGVVLFSVILAAYLFRRLGFSGEEVFVYAAIWGLISLGVMFFVSRKLGFMIHCTTFCPMGFIATLFGKISPWRLRIGNKCCQCGACFKKCRYNALDTKMVQSGHPALSCTLCGDCVSACVHKQIEYHFLHLKPMDARTLFIVLIVSLHAIFLGVARM